MSLWFHVEGGKFSVGSMIKRQPPATIGDGRVLSPSMMPMKLGIFCALRWCAFCLLTGPTAIKCPAQSNPDFTHTTY